MKARCVMNDGECGYFTDGKVYEVHASLTGRIGEVTDDHGHNRVIPLDGGPCAHITKGYATSGWLKPHTLPGYWEVIQ